MGDSPTYSVEINGEIKPGFDLPQIQQAFAKLFNINPEKAASFVGSKKIVKKDIDIKTAHAFKNKLEEIGLVVILKEQLQVPALELEPTEEKTETVNQSEQSPENTYTCPECNLKQPKTMQCIGCGAFVQELQRESTENINNTDQDAAPVQDQESVVSYENKAFNIKALMVAAVAAILGALLWKFIAVQFDYELGLIAWLIGGAVGFGAAISGSKGQTAGVICGILTLLAILGGKYMAMESFQTELVESFSASTELYEKEMREAYNQELIAAEAYVNNSSDEESLRQFMLDYGYSDSLDAEAVTNEEIDFFKENIHSRLEALELNNPEYEQWVEDIFQNEIQGISTLDLMEENIGFIDLVFLVLGIGTAFRLGSGSLES